MKNIIIAYMSVLGMASAYAASDDVVNSQMYVDNAAGNLQTNLPAKTSEKVVTYTTTAGTTGERDIKTELGNESTNQADTGIPTAGTVKTAVDGKQRKSAIYPLPDSNIITYTGTNDNAAASNAYYGSGVIATTPIYNDTINTFDNGLVTAKTLNDAIIAGVNAEATKITTDPKGALWVFNRTPPKVLPTTANLPANIGGLGRCYRRVLTDEAKTNESINHSDGCSSTLFNNLNRGDWGISFSYKTGITYPNDNCIGTNCYNEIHGISVCASNGGHSTYKTVSPDNTTFISELNAAYESGKTGTTPNGASCFCKLIEPMVAAARWMFYRTYDTPTKCAVSCAESCSALVYAYSPYRSIIFSAASVPIE